MSKIQEQTIKELKKDIKHGEKLLKNVWNWCNKDSSLYFNITRDHTIKNWFKGDKK